jgi:hypothetical protein
LAFERTKYNARAAPSRNVRSCFFHGILLLRWEVTAKYWRHARSVVAGKRRQHEGR